MSEEGIKVIIPSERIENTRTTQKPRSFYTEYLRQKKE